MKLIFQRGDVLIDQGNPGVDDQEIVIDGDVQLTYGTLREVNTSNPIAHLNNDEEWYIESGRFDGVADLGPYSDVIITNQEG